MKSIFLQHYSWMRSIKTHNEVISSKIYNQHSFNTVITSVNCVFKQIKENNEN